MQCEPRPAEVTKVFDPDTSGIDFDPARFRRRHVVIKLELHLPPVGLECLELDRTFSLRREIDLLPSSVDRVLNAQPPGLVHLPQPGDDPLSRTTGTAVRFNERPVRRTAAFFLLKVLANEHGERSYSRFTHQPDH